MNVAGTSDAATLNLTLAGGGTTGAIGVKRNGTGNTTTHYGAQTCLVLTYDGTAWRTDGDYDSNSNDTSTGYYRYANGTFVTKTALYRYQILLTYDETSVFPINTVSNSTATTKALTTESFNPFKPIYYYSATSTVSANAAISKDYLWRGRADINLGYSFNTGTTLTSNKDVYLVATMQSNGMAKLATDVDPITQQIPATENGHIYILLGHAYSTSNIVLYEDHPIFIYTDGVVKLYNRNSYALRLANNRKYDGSEYIDLLSNDLKTAVSKVYESTGFIGTANDYENTTWYFMSVHPNGWYQSWRVRFKIRSYCPSYTNVDSTSWIELYGRNTTVDAYKIFNQFHDRGHYYICDYPLKADGFNAGYGVAIGISIRYAVNYTTAACYRTFEVDFYDSDGCTVALLDTPVKWSNWEGNTNTNYGSIQVYDACSRGLQETSDANTVDVINLSNAYMINGSSMRMSPYTLFGISRDDKAQPISIYSDGYSSSTTNINTARLYNTTGIDYTKGLFYFNNGSNWAANANLDISPRKVSCAIDFRYTDNCVAASSATTLGMIARKPVYLRGVIKNDGLFYLAPIEVTYNNATYKRAWTQDIPTQVETDGTYQYVYWFIGYPYYNGSYANSLYQIDLFPENKIYWYHNGRFEDYEAQDYTDVFVKKSGDVMTGNLAIKFGDTDKHIMFDYDGDGSAGASWRIAALGTGSNDTNYLVFQSGTSTTSATTWNNAIRIGQNTYDAAFGGNVYPLSNDSKTLGTSSLKWSNVYATTFTGALTGNASTATKFASAQSVALTGDVTGSASSQAGWSIATTIGTGKVTNAMLAGSIANNKLANSSVSIAGNSVSLGGSLDASTLTSSLGLSSAMHFIGVATVAITDGSTTNPTISGYDFANNKKAGDVIIDSSSSREYVWTTASKWELLGGDSSYKTTQTAVTKPTAATNQWVSAIGQDANGVISVDYASLVTTGTWSGTATTATKLSNTSAIGGTDRPVYFTSGGIPAQTTYRMAATNVTATAARAITDNLETGIWYVNGTNSTDLYSQSDGACFVNKYSDSWIAEIYQDYRTGQIAVRGKNNGTWQDWRKVLDNKTTYAASTSAVSITWNTETTIATIGGTAVKIKIPSNPNSDTKVKQSASTTDSWRKLLLHHTADGTSTAAVATDTDEIYGAIDISAQPSTGTVRANIYNVKDKVKLEYNTTVDTLNFVFI